MTASRLPCAAAAGWPVGAALAIALLAAPALTQAQGVVWEAPATPTDADVDAGREAYLRGLTALEGGDPSGALAEFRLSYRLSGAAAALFNGAFALARLERWADASRALAALERIDANDEVRASAEALAREVEASLAYLRILGIPEGAAVSVDGAPVDAPGPELAHPVDPGAHRLEVRAPPAPPFRWQGELVAGERRAVAVALDAATSGGGGDDGPIVAAILVVVGALAVAGVAVGVAVALDEAAQLSPSAPHVVELP